MFSHAALWLKHGDVVEVKLKVWALFAIAWSMAKGTAQDGAPQDTRSSPVSSTSLPMLHVYQRQGFVDGKGRGSRARLMRPQGRCGWKTFVLPNPTFVCLNQRSGLYRFRSVASMNGHAATVTTSFALGEAAVRDSTGCAAGSSGDRLCDNGIDFPVGNRGNRPLLSGDGAA